MKKTHHHSQSSRTNTSRLYQRLAGKTLPHPAAPPITPPHARARASPTPTRARTHTQEIFHTIPTRHHPRRAPAARAARANAHLETLNLAPRQASCVIVPAAARARATAAAPRASSNRRGRIASYVPWSRAWRANRCIAGLEP